MWERKGGAIEREARRETHTHTEKHPFVASLIYASISLLLYVLWQEMEPTLRHIGWHFNKLSYTARAQRPYIIECLQVAGIVIDIWFLSQAKRIRKIYVSAQQNIPFLSLLHVLLICLETNSSLPSLSVSWSTLVTTTTRSLLILTISRGTPASRSQVY